MVRALGSLPDRWERKGQDGGTVERRQPSEAGRRTRNWSRLIVPRKAGNPPQGTRWREEADRSAGLLEGKRARTSSPEIISTRQEKRATFEERFFALLVSTAFPLSRLREAHPKGLALTGSKASTLRAGGQASEASALLPPWRRAGVNGRVSGQRGQRPLLSNMRWSAKRTPFRPCRRHGAKGALAPGGLGRARARIRNRLRKD
jgi:hypothetical protein